MFLGHYAVALGAKRWAPRTSLGVLVAAAQLADLVWPVFLLLGWERVAPGDHGFTALRFVHYPWSHSLAMMVAWGLAAAIVYRLAAGGRDRAGPTAVFLLVVSHWALDWVVHVPDLPLYPGGSARLGLGLWTSTLGTIVVEGLLWVVGIAIYLRATTPRNRAGRFVFWALVLALTAVYASSVSSPPPADQTALAWFAMAGWLIPFWAAWADRNRTPTGAAASPA